MSDSTDATPRPRVRGGVVLIQHGRVAVIERRRPGLVYFVFPGGGCEAGETPADAAVREGYEELGLHLRLGGLLAVVTFGAGVQHYFEAAVLGGLFGTGTGPEMASTASSAEGTHRAVWLGLDDLLSNDLRPTSVRDRIAGTPAQAACALADLTESPLRVAEE